MCIVNMTPHAVTLIVNEKVSMTFESEGVLRLETVSTGAVESLSGFPEVEVVFEGVADAERSIIELAERRAAKRIIVSSVVLDALPPGSLALRYAAAPDTSPESVARDGEGHIVGVRRLRVRREDNE